MHKVVDIISLYCGCSAVVYEVVVLLFQWHVGCPLAGPPNDASLLAYALQVFSSLSVPTIQHIVTENVGCSSSC